MSAAAVNAVIARLKANVPALYNRVEKATDLSELIGKNLLPPQMPSAYVIWSGDRPQPAADMNITRQQVAETVSVVLVNKKAGDATGVKASDESDLIGDAVREALVGYQIDGSFDPFEYQRGQLLGMQAGAVFIQIDVMTRWQLRA